MPANKRGAGGTEPRYYEIRVRGPIGPTTMQAFPAFTATQRGHDTLLSGSLPDQSALYGVISQLEALALQLVEIRSRSLAAAGRRAPSHDRCEDDSSSAV